MDRQSRSNTAPIEGRVVMPIKPGKDESQSEWMSRCVSEMMGPNKDKRPQEQAVAACLTMWRDEKGGKKPPEKQYDDADPIPEDGESDDDFIERCVDEMSSGHNGIDEEAAEDRCQIIWDERRYAGAKTRGDASGVVHKTHTADIAPNHLFILSDESVDRMGDVIMSSGWDIRSFSKNPVALFNHRSDWVIGTWKNLHVEKGQLRGHLEFAPKGISPRIDEVRALVEAGILKAVSVGFRPIQSEPLKKDDPFGGFRFHKQELVETSLVSIPANPNALQVAKGLNISASTLDLVFAAHGKENRSDERRGFRGAHADQQQHQSSRKESAMSLGQRITEIEGRIVERKDKLAEHLKRVDDSNVSDTDLQTTQDLNSEIVQLEKQRGALKDAEGLLAKDAATDGNGTRTRALATTAFTNGGGGPIMFRKKDANVLDYIANAGTILYCSKVWNQPIETVRQKIFGDDDATKVVCDLVLRAPSAPAMTSVTGWAAELVQQIYTAPMDLLIPNAVYRRLAAKGLALSFGRAGKIVVPTRSRTPTIAGSFVGEGLAIPVRQGAFTSVTLTPKKLAVISVFTREMDEHSVPAIQGILREAMQIDTEI